MRSARSFRRSAASAPLVPGTRGGTCRLASARHQRRVRHMKSKSGSQSGSGSSSSSSIWLLIPARSSSHIVSVSPHRRQPKRRGRNQTSPYSPDLSRPPAKPLCPHAGQSAGTVSGHRAAVGSAERLLTSSAISGSDRLRVVSAKRSRARRSSRAVAAPRGRTHPGEGAPARRARERADAVRERAPATGRQGHVANDKK